ncbi:MAG: hypothetical protein OEV21_07365 [Thermoplasmata archaeon]|nr:hypothetical protein [Thermoplasmata archaeon]
MNKIKILKTIGSILISIGIIGIIWGIQPEENATTHDIPAGAEWCCYAEISLVLNGHISGEFNTMDSGTVHFFVMSSDQFDRYLLGLSTSNMYSYTGTGTTFSVDLPTASTYYLVFDHGTGYLNIIQHIDLTYKLTGLFLIFFIAGAVIITIGIIIILFAFRMKKKEEALGETTDLRTENIDVITFDKK